MYRTMIVNIILIIHIAKYIIILINIILIIYITI